MSKEHDNQFDLNMAGIANFEFTVEEYCISSGQPWGGVTTETLTGIGRINVEAGRHGTSEVAQRFTEQLDQGSCIGNSSSSTLPSNLNFAFIGTMSYEHNNKKRVCNNVLIGQGHSTRNTWWLGGPAMSGLDTPLGGAIKSPTTNKLTFLVFNSFAGAISHMNMGEFSL